MADERKPMTTAVLNGESGFATRQGRLKAELQRGDVRLVAWLQRGLLALLVLAHVVYPFWLGNKSDLLRDSVILAQAAVVLSLVVLGGMSWFARIGLLLVAMIPAAGWYFVYTDYLRGYAVAWLLPYIVCTATTLLGLKIYGYRGSWRDDQLEPPRLQISIRSLLIVTTVVAAVLTGSSWLRNDNESGWDADTRLWVNVFIDGAVAAVLTALMVCTTGRRGSPVLRHLILLAALLFLGACNIYAFNMESYWQLSALTMLGWGLIAIGSLMICRMCGWHVILPRCDVRPAPAKG